MGAVLTSTAAAAQQQAAAEQQAKAMRENSAREARAAQEEALRDAHAARTRELAAEIVDLKKQKQALDKQVVGLRNSNAALRALPRTTAEAVEAAGKPKIDALKEEWRLLTQQYATA